MAAYGYGPPPPPPPASQSSGGYGQYQQPYPSRGGRGGGHRSGGRDSDYQNASGYSYGSQSAQAYGQQGYPTAPPQQGSYAQNAQWAPDPASQGHQQHLAAHNQLPPQAYHASYAPQVYQQHQPSSSSLHHYSAPAPAPYGQHSPYAPPSGAPQAYGQQYHPAQPPAGHAPPSQWGSPTHTQQGVGQGGPYRGRGGHYERGSKAQMMGPPIRIGFDNGGLQGASQGALVSSSYQPPPPPPYRHAQESTVPLGRPSGYAPGPYYPPAGAAPPAGPPSYDPYYNQNGRPYGRGGYQSTSYRGGRGNFGDKMRHKRIGGGPMKAGPPHHQKPDAASAGKKKKRKTNTLGLTPGEESDEDDVDEEAKLVELIGPDAPNPTDIAAWIEQRRKHFPTQARVAAKLSSEAEADKAGKTGVSSANGKNGSAGLTALERKQQKAEKLRKQLEKVESSIKRKREQQDEGDEMREDDESSDGSEDAKLDDEAPEALPIRSEVAMPPAPKRADHSKHCKYYSTGGTCGKKGKCRFVHDPTVREAALREREHNGGRMTLQQRLTLNDKDQEDLTIVKTLQYLREKGIIDERQSQPAAEAPVAAAATASATSPSAAAPTVDIEATPMAPAPETHGLPKPPMSALPGPPGTAGPATPAGPYQGWNLSGFGNTGVKPADV